MKALGMTCGIGSMLIGARVAGFEILGNCEWRKYYSKRDEKGRNTFEENFPGTVFCEKFDQLPPEIIGDHAEQIDLVMGHADCGNFSTLSHSRGDMSKLQKNPGDIPILVENLQKLRPRFFVLDNLPRSLEAYTMEEYAKAFPDYDIFPEWICNWRYGNIQKMRKRLFIIGALKSENFVFTAGEKVNTDTMDEVLHSKSYYGVANNETHSLEGKTSIGRGMVTDTYMTWEQVQNYVLNRLPEGKEVEYMKEGEVKRHMGTHKFYKDKHGFVLTGSTSYPLSPWTGLPFSIRERARIQGCPDDFIFYGTKLKSPGVWACNNNTHMVKQIAKFMPIQFCTYIAHQIADHINGIPAPEESVRLLNPNRFIDAAKLWYCENVGYSNQELVCKKCWGTPCGLKKFKR